MPAKRGAPFHKQALAALRAINKTYERTRRKPDTDNGKLKLSHQIAGIAGLICGTTLPAYHRPLAFELRRARRLVEVEVRSSGVLDTAIAWIKTERIRAAVKKMHSAKKQAPLVEPALAGAGTFDEQQPMVPRGDAEANALLQQA
ncbi:MAG TPA: hypothetical protein VHD38_02720 [Candidatus Paceibacterota bacterium]|nr:hypothetical protein [Candidatus Paceibacterota bacterium]